MHRRMVSGTRRRVRREERGYVLLLVLALTVILMVGATGFYKSTDAHLLAFKQVRLQAIATANANAGAEDAISKIRASVISLTPPSTICPANLAPCDAVYGGNAAPYNGLDSNNNVLYTVTIFHRTIPGFSHTMVMVSSTGYGVPLPAGQVDNLQITSRVDVQVQTAVANTQGNSVAGGS